jgi:hypothetical protein
VARNLEVVIPPPGADKSLSRLLEFEKEPTDCYINKAYAIEDSDCNAQRERKALLPFEVQNIEARGLYALSQQRKVKRI